MKIRPWGERASVMGIYSRFHRTCRRVGIKYISASPRQQVRVDWLRDSFLNSTIRRFAQALNHGFGLSSGFSAIRCRGRSAEGVRAIPPLVPCGAPMSHENHGVLEGLGGLGGSVSSRARRLSTFFFRRRRRSLLFPRCFGLLSPVSESQPFGTVPMRQGRTNGA
jgi:hypothetical protein